MTKTKFKNQKGVAILFVILLMGILLSMVLTLSSIFAPKIRTSFDVNSSVGAIYAAESAAEWCLYVNRYGSTTMPVMDNGASYKNGLVSPPRDFVDADCAGNSIRAVGTYRGVTRSFELAGF